MVQGIQSLVISTQQEVFSIFVDYFVESVLTGISEQIFQVSANCLLAPIKDYIRRVEILHSTRIEDFSELKPSEFVWRQETHLKSSWKDSILMTASY